MPAQSNDLWSLVKGKPQVDPTDLAVAVQEQACQPELDFRTRLLIRDSMNALQRHWGHPRLSRWLASSIARSRLEEIWHEDLGETRFTVAERIMDKTDPEEIRQFLRELGDHVRHTQRLLIGGSVALILPGHLSRATDDVDVVDEVPEEVRSLHTVLKELRDRFGLRLTHFQSHYLPEGWQNRVHSLEPFGRLRISLVDVYDVFLSKLFSGRTKDRDDLRALLPQLDREVLTRKFLETTPRLRADARFLENAQKNWYILTGEALPT